MTELPTRMLFGAAVGKALRAALADRVRALSAAGTVPRLHLVRLGARPDDRAYQASIARPAERLGIAIGADELPANTTQDELDAALARANADPTVHGIMVFQPLPGHLDTARVNGLIDPAKDVDGLSPINQALVYQGSPEGVPPCTPAAVVALLRHHGVPLVGARVVVVGRSLVVGKPLAMLLLDQQATVTVCHSRTVDLPTVTRSGDIVVAALGRDRFLGADYFRAGQTVVDVGIHVDADGSLTGDVDDQAVTGLVAAFAPARGGVGAATSAILFEHVVAAAERAAGKD